MKYLTSTRFAPEITVLEGSKTQDSNGDTTFVHTGSLTFNAVISHSAENEQRLSIGQGVFADAIAYCKWSDIEPYFVPALITYRVLYGADTYEIVKVDDVPLGTVRAYVALYLRRL